MYRRGCSAGVEPRPARHAGTGACPDRASHCRGAGDGGAANHTVCYQAALALAQELGAKSSELRAATQLGRFCQQQGRPDAGRQLLGDLYGWFSEGFASVDLRTARQLLDELAGL